MFHAITSRRRLARGLFALGLAGLVLGAQPARAETVLTLSNWLPPTHPIVTDMLGPWQESVASASGGELRIEMLKAPLGKPAAHFDIARNGLADITFAAHGYTPGRFPLTNVVEQPFMTPSSEAMSVAFWRLFEKTPALQAEHDGVHVVSLFTHGPGHFFNTRRPVTSLADAEGLKMRIGGRTAAAVGERLKVVSVPVPPPEVFNAVSRGVVDGVLFPDESVAFFKIDRAIRYGTAVPGGLYNTSFFVVMNQAKYDSLSPEMQRVLDLTAGETFARRAGKAWDSADARGRQTNLAAGMEIIQPSPEFLADLKETLAPVTEAWIAEAAEQGVDGRALLTELEAELARADQ
ncbi:TRAP transporter substrate-binding protein [Roseospirillum parvum]|uniref:TRAP-type C4-dicarboxylate transport system, substrate-binding protein n=1 Tax=Roseospirillum parvum TaxID=83401 RepID=A0A1G7X3N0_9PROT|nr:TRAP transporter substrate-binding protein [Roseospirillum parvum]SDG78803.1 TRAP-type C4-dicarboxylate transport system, substrate-binding protein [Roseospirillum parvum]